jgi:deoxyadenosine/deoxycytidine kinase/NTP pyrophosphatase (non-canonical NTP hydrolase)
MLREHYASGLLLEVFEENPFLAAFYGDRERYAFQTQMFFLLSRYRQQQQILPLLRQGSLITDYMFDKDWLFARLNLKDDEWAVYQQVHRALSAHIPAADLVVYLQADTDVLMGRIAQRDRTYERDMDRDYIAELRRVYEQFFREEKGTKVLALDTNNLNIITREKDFQSIVERINGALQQGTFQQSLPEFDLAEPETSKLPLDRPLQKYQKLHVDMDLAKGFNTNVYFNYLCLSEEMGELGSELAGLWRAQDEEIAAGKDESHALQTALSDKRAGLESELADCMAYLLKLANYTGIDLEAAYRAKMNTNVDRTWPTKKG